MDDQTENLPPHSVDLIKRLRGIYPRHAASDLHALPDADLRLHLGQQSVVEFLEAWLESSLQEQTTNSVYRETPEG